MHAARQIAIDAQAAGYKVGIVKDSAVPGWTSKIKGHRFGNRYAVSIYRDDAGEMSELARLVWAYVDSGRTRSVLAFAGVRDETGFVDTHGLSHVRAALGLHTDSVAKP